MKARPLFASIALATLTCLAGAQEHSFEYKPAKGEKLAYSFTFDIMGFGQPLLYKATISNEVVDVYEDGGYLMASSQGDSVVVLDGDEQPTIAESVTAVTTYDKLGRPLKIGGDNATPESFRVANLTAFISAGRAIKLGEGWTVEIPGDKEAKTVAVTQQYKLIQVADGKAVVEFSVAETEGENRATAKGKITIDLSTLRAIRYEAQVTDLPVGVQLVSGKIEMVLKAS